MQEVTQMKRFFSLDLNDKIDVIEFRCNENSVGGKLERMLRWEKFGKFLDKQRRLRVVSN